MPILRAPPKGVRYFPPETPPAAPAQSVVSPAHFDYYGNGTYAFGKLGGYWPLMYDASKLAVPFDPCGLIWAAMPDIYGAPWLVAIARENKAPLYDTLTLANSNAIVDARNGMDKSDECNYHANAYPDGNDGNVVMYSAQGEARNSYFAFLRKNYRNLGIPLIEGAFYAWDNFPNFNPAKPQWGYGAQDWEPQQNSCVVAKSPSGGDGPWNFAPGRCYVEPRINSARFPNGPAGGPDCTLLNEITFQFVDSKTKEVWFFTAFGDTVTRTCYLTSAINETRKAELIRDCRKKRLEWYKALAIAIGETIKAIVAIIIGVVTLNVGMIGAAVASIVIAWYNFAQAQAALEEALKKAQGEGNANVDLGEAAVEVFHRKVGFAPNDIERARQERDRRNGIGADGGSILDIPGGDYLIPVVIAAGVMVAAS